MLTWFMPQDLSFVPLPGFLWFRFLKDGIQIFGTVSELQKNGDGNTERSPEPCAWPLL